MMTFADELTPTKRDSTAAALQSDKLWRSLSTVNTVSASLRHSHEVTMIDKFTAMNIVGPGSDRLDNDG